MDILYFVGLIIFALAFVYFDYAESRKGKYRNRYKVLAFRSVVLTIVVVLTFQLWQQNVTIEKGHYEVYTYKADNITIDKIEIVPNTQVIPLNDLAKTIFMLLMLYMVYWITAVFEK